MKYVVTGGAGFIGSHIVDRLLLQGNEVLCLDNFLTGKKENLLLAGQNKNFKLVVSDLTDINALAKLFKGADAIFHFAANADIRGGMANTRKDLELNTIATYNVLEAMRLSGVRQIVFASSSAVYGEPAVFPTPEDHPLIVTSLYGASKIACEALIGAYCSTFEFQSWMFRFVGVIGERHSHGVIFDFMNKLKKNSNELEIIGNGKQVKSFIYVCDCIDGIFFAWNKAREQINIYNLGTDEDIEIKKLADIVVNELGLRNVKYRFTGGLRGWKGDAPVVRLSIAKIKQLGWKPKLSIEESIRKTVGWLAEANKNTKE